MSDELYGKKILVVEDNVDDRTLLLQRLTPYHLIPEIAENLMQGYEALDRFKPDLILIDVILPFNSLSTVPADFQRVLEFVSKVSAGGIAPIMFTGDLHQEYIKAALAAGACEWIPKDASMSSEELRRLIARAYSAHCSEYAARLVELTPGQKILFEQGQANRLDMVFMRATQTVSVLAAAKLVKETAGKATDKALEMAKEQAFERGRKVERESARKKRIAARAAAIVSLGTLLWNMREIIKGIVVALKHKFG